MKSLTYLMPVRRVALLAVLMLLSSHAFADLQPRNFPHSATVAPAPAASSPHTADAKLGPGHEASVVQTVKRSDAPAARVDEAEHRAWEVDSANRTYGLGAVMAVIATVQLILFGIQLAMMRRNIVDTANAARAAELNAKAAIGIELPFLRAIPSDLLGMAEPIPEDGSYGGYVNDGPPITYNALGPIEISNLGRTPAYSLVVSFGWLVARVLPAQPPPYQRTINLNHNLVVSPGTETNIHPDACITLSDEEVMETARDEKWLWIFGEIDYRDFMDQQQTARFCWRFANRNPPGSPALYYLASDGQPPTAYTRRTTVINV